MNRLARMAVVAMGTGLLPFAVARAELPATQPSSDQPVPAQSSSAQTLSAQNRPLPYTSQEWDAMMAFMQQHSPARWNVLSGLDPGQGMPIRREAMRKWRNYQFVSEHFPRMAELMEKRFELDDALFMFEEEARERGPDLLAIQQKIHDKVAEIVDLDLAQQKARIDRLQALIDRQQALLKLEMSQYQHDLKSKDEIVDRRANSIWSKLIRPLKLEQATSRPDVTSAESAPPAASPNESLLNLSSPASSGK